MKIEDCRSKTGAIRVRVGIFILPALLLLWVIAFAPLSASENHAYGVTAHVMKRGSFRLPGGVEVGDLVISDGDVEIMGRVRGSVFVVDGEVTIFSGGEVFGNVTVIDEDLRLKTGSIVRGSIFVIGGRVEREEGARVEGEIDQKREELSYESQRLLEEYLVFERPIPPHHSPDEIFNSLDKDLRGWRDLTVASWTGLVLEELPAIELPGSAASNARIGMWRRGSWEILVGVARFRDAEEAAGFWEAVHGKWSEEQISRSVHVSLGGGAHWFFRHGDRSAALWIKGDCLVMLDVGTVPGKEGSAHYAEHLREYVMEWIVRAWSKK